MNSSIAFPKGCGPSPTIGRQTPHQGAKFRPAGVASCRPRLLLRPAMTDAARDYSETLFLPKTDFPMRAGLPQKEPEILKRWQSLGLYERMRAAARGRPKFILHDGP